MATFNKKTPGVYIEEISKFPPSIAAVETAIPAFIGYTESAADANTGASLTDIPTRITSLLEYERLFGKAKHHKVNVTVVQEGTTIAVSFASPPVEPDDFLYYSIQLFYANGGGPCYIVSVGSGPHTGTAATAADFTDAIKILEGFDEPTLLVFPDITKLATAANRKTVVEAALTHCKDMQDRFTIIDIPGALGTTNIVNAVDDFRTDELPSDLDLVKYGAVYTPHLHTLQPFRIDDADITIDSYTVDGVPDATVATKTLAETTPNIKADFTALYNAVKLFTNATTVTIPPSGGVAGVYARVDASRGVWKAPANVSLLNVIEPAIKITNTENDGLNIDATSGKSVNAIRAFTGKGTLVWGARTLAGNDNENRYVPVRRFLIFAEESIKKAVTFFVFEPNDNNTWTKVRSMIEAFLTRQWRDGALAGAKPEDAFYVAVGLNKTMTAQDILEGYMIVEIGLAIVRPAEFIVLQFSQLMQKS